MSMGACLSVLGLYNYDNTIFDLMSFPEEFTTDDKKTVIDNILVECAELEVLYPSSTVMKNIIGIWSKKELPYWDRVYKAAQLEYNPIENYRRNESEKLEDDRTEEHSGSDKLDKNGNDVSVSNGSDFSNVKSRTYEEAGGNDRTDNNITGYDNNTLVPNTETEVYYGKSNTANSTGEQSTSYGRNDTIIHNTQDVQTYGEKIKHGGKTDRTVLAYGNIGVTTSQEMLTQEMEIAKIINVIPVIIESFKDRFCLMVY